MRTLMCLFFILLPACAFSQMTAIRQKSMNAYVEYANQSADEINSIVKSIIEYYPVLERKNPTVARYICPFQLDDYYVSTAIAQSQHLPVTVATSLNRAIENLRHAEKKADQKCKALDTYHKLEDYKQDHFGNAKKMISELQVLVGEYQKQQDIFRLALATAYKELNGSPAANAYRMADAKMLSVISYEKTILDLWAYNLKESIHTGWPIDKLQASIPETDKQLEALKKINPALKYPASSMWPHFQESVVSVLEVKRGALDAYNFEAKKSDRHANDVYLNLINYYNGTLVSDYNTFIQFSERDGYFGQKAIKYVSVFEIRETPEKLAVQAKPFKEIPNAQLNITAEKKPIAGPAFDALSNYVELINETWRQTNYLQSVLSNFSSSAASFKNLESYDRRAPMRFDYGKFQVPLSYFQKTISASRALSPAYAKSLNEQTEVLLNILKEMDEQCAVLDGEVSTRKYEQDHLKNVYAILERQAELFSIWDNKKEELYGDLRAIYNSYPPQDAASPWQVSGKELRDLVDLDHEALFRAKTFYGGDTTVVISTDKIDKSLREVIANEYDNMKGIRKIGRNNGLCPYTPYEDLPETSRQLSERFKELKPAKGTGYSHPYHSMVYLYNEIVDDYNKFSELSATVYHLKTIKQPELFTVKDPEPKSSGRAVSNQPVKTVAEHQENKKTANVPATSPTNGGEKRTVVVRDTVYIEKRDTVYLTAAAENLHSMEGYASNNMILLLDVSGSMNQPEKLPVLKQSVLDILSMMREEDRISIIAFSGKPKVLLKNSSFTEAEKIKKAVKELSSSGKTDGDAGLRLAYKVADENYIRGGNNRIVLATDGEFALDEETLALITKFSKEDIFLSVFNFGKGMGSSRNLEKLANLGNGNYGSISKENVELKLIGEVKAKRKK